MPTETARVPVPIATGSLPWEGFEEIPKFRSRWRHLTRGAWGPDYRIGVVVEEIPPGGQSAPFHYHFVEEEHVYARRLLPQIVGGRDLALRENFLATSGLDLFRVEELESAYVHNRLGAALLRATST